MRKILAASTALALGGTAVALAMGPSAGAQVAQNTDAQMARVVPRAGAPTSFADLVEQLQPAVVNIATKRKVAVGRRMDTGQIVTEEQPGGGSGFLISSDGYLVTNNHVITAGTRDDVVNEVTVTLTNRREYKATVVGRDVASDLALLKIDAKGLPFVNFADSNTARVGDWVVAIGNPLGIGSTVTAGIISAVHRNIGQGGAYDRYIQTDTAINRGNSGGPLFDLNGNVVGVNNMLISPVGANIGINFAIPAEQARPVIDALRRGARPTRGFLGVGIAPLAPEYADELGIERSRGEFVQRVEADGPAAKAGVERGDVVLSVNGRDVTPDNSLSYIVANIAPGTRIPLVVLRDGKRMTLTAVVGTRPPEDRIAQFDENEKRDIADEQSTNAHDEAVRTGLGLAVESLTPEIAGQIGLPTTTKGLIIAAVDQTADAAQRGLGRGMVITGADRQPVTTVEGLAKAIATAKANKRSFVMLDILRRGAPPVLIPVRIR